MAEDIQRKAEGREKRLCPSCGAEMEPGYLAGGGRQIDWIAERPKTWLGRMFRMYEDDPDNVLDEDFCGPYISSWRCRTCRLVLSEY